EGCRYRDNGRRPQEHLALRWPRDQRGQRHLLKCKARWELHRWREYRWLRIRPFGGERFDQYIAFSFDHASRTHKFLRWWKCCVEGRKSDVQGLKLAPRWPQEGRRRKPEL